MKLLLITICLLISNITLAGDQVGCTHQTTKFTYSNFDKRLDRINRKYNTSGSSSLAASFSTATHPGDFPFLTRNSKLYSVPSVGDPALSTLKICHWSTVEQDKKSTQIDAYNLAFFNQSRDHSLELTQCLNKLSNKDQSFSVMPSIAQAVTLCAIEEGLLD